MKRAAWNGFTLLELLVVIVIMSILLALGVPAFQRIMEGQAPRAEAEQFVSALRSARQYAIDNNVRTRVVFASGDLVSRNPDLVTNAYGAFSFYVPRQPGGGSGFLSPVVGTNTMLEYLQIPWISVPSGFVGQWIPLKGQERWVIPNPRVKMESDLLSQTVNSVFLAQNYYQPPRYWDYAGTNFYQSNVVSATSPKNYHQTPYPFSYPRTTTYTAPNEPSVYLDPSGTPVSYSVLWPTNAPYNYYTGIVERLGDFKKLGQAETAATTGRRFFDLAGIEFDPDGRPAFRWTNELKFKFVHRKSTNDSIEVILGRTTGMARFQ